MEPMNAEQSSPGLSTLPGDDVRQILWRFADRYELHMLVQAARGVALAPGAYEIFFISLAHTVAELERTVSIAADAAKEMTA